MGHAMHTLPASNLLAVAAFMAALGLAAPAFAADETGADIPKNAYHDATLTPTEREAIADEENISPNDGRKSLPPREARGIIPDAADPIDQKEQVAPAPAHKTAESEADVILDDSKKYNRVTQKDLDKCMQEWDAQSQMSKSEWAESCRTTLEYFPEEEN
jgi:hypothetical protein